MARTKKDANKKHYFSEVDPSELAEVFAKAISDEMEIKIWEQGKSEKEVETFVGKDFTPETRVLEVAMAGGLLSKLSSSKLTDKEVFIKVGSDKFQFFSTTILEYDKDSKKYFLPITRSVFKTQQRSNYRLQKGPHIRIQFRIDDDTLQEGLDISAGGTSFIVSEEEGPRYVKDHIFKDCKLGLNNDKFNIPSAKVAGTWPVKDSNDQPTGELKVGIAFGDITDDTEEALFKSINGEARAEEMRKKMLQKKIEKEKEKAGQ
jgi:c-di-GMP-binding flagellar brake protein YcgR